MTALVVFPDIEAAVVAWGKTAFPAHGITAKIATKMPTPRTNPFVLVASGGGARRDVITDRPRVILECWDTSEPAASQLARTVRALIGAAAPGRIGGVWCDLVLDAGLAKSPDPDTGTPRYLVTVELHVTGTAL